METPFNSCIMLTVCLFKTELSDGGEACLVDGGGIDILCTLLSILRQVNAFNGNRSTCPDLNQVELRRREIITS